MEMAIIMLAVTFGRCSMGAVVILTCRGPVLARLWLNLTLLTIMPCFADGRLWQHVNVCLLAQQ